MADQEVRRQLAEIRCELQIELPPNGCGEMSCPGDKVLCEMCWNWADGIIALVEG